MTRLFILLALSLVGACTQVQAPEATYVDPCGPPSPNGQYAFWDETPVVMPGDSLMLDPYFVDGAGEHHAVPPACVAAVTLSDDGLGDLSMDDTRLTIGNGTALGSEIAINARIGAQPVSGKITVDLPEGADPLVGLWVQQTEECPGTEPVRELVFRPDGRFSVTWAPLESYQDFWGTYDFDADTRRLVLQVSGANHRPEDALLTGTVTLSDRLLDLRDVFLGSPPAPLAAGCRAPFHKFGATRS